MSSLNQLSLTGMLNAIEQGDCLPSDIWRSCLHQIDRYDRDVHAWQQLYCLADESQAIHLENTRFPLQGLPIGIKDTIDVLGMRAERGSRVWQGREAPADASCISALKHAGGRVIGKTVTTEFAYFTPGATANPHNLAHTPGGSSSGSAAAVAAGMVPVALGSQTAASLIRPAAYCGVVGYVASVGSVSLRGVMPLAHTLDALGLVTRDVADVHYVQALLTRAPVKQGRVRRKPEAVLAVDGRAFGAVDAEMLALHQRTLDGLASQGVRIYTVTDELGAEGGQKLAQWHHELMAYEAAQTLSFEYHEHADGLSRALQDLIEEGLGIDGERYEELKSLRDMAMAKFARAMDRYDAVLAPAAPGAAPRGLEATGRPDQSRAWQLLGVPQITLPAGVDDASMPLGMQLIGRQRGDVRLLDIALWFQDELGWKGEIPPAFRRQ
ncbi:MAG TPA: amidase [Rhodoferax sp.]|nr:amidase [Rhodoferax sp.]